MPKSMTTRESVVMDLEMAPDDFDTSSSATTISTFASSTPSTPCDPTRLSPIDPRIELRVNDVKSSACTIIFPVATTNEKRKPKIDRTNVKRRKLTMPAKGIGRRPRRHIIDHEAKRVAKDTKAALKASLETFQNEACTRELLTKASSNVPVQRFRRCDMYKTTDFKRLWKLVEVELGATTEQIESGSLVRDANNNDLTGRKSYTRCTLSASQKRAQYGRILFPGMQTIIKIANLRRDEIFIDIGHGIGNAVLQAAFMVGCESRGIEVVPNRCRIAEQFREIMLENADIELNNRERMRYKVGKIELREGSLTDKKHEQFITEANVILVNNANEIFGTRSGDVEGKATLDTHLARLFTKMKPGTRMITLHPILCLGKSLSEENERRRKKGMEESLDASFFTCEKKSMGFEVVNWSTKEIPVWLYTRVHQSTTDGTAVFLCSNKKCCWKGNPSAALDKDGFLQEECVYCLTKRSGSRRR